VRQNILAESLGMTPMSVTGFVCRLESAGLVERETDPEDRRANIIRLTQKADSVLAAIFGIGSEITAIAGGDMSEGELEALRVELCGVRDRLEAARHSIGCSKENRDG
jgi:DNA-binding MarR family transcriptional regulator